MHNTSSPWQVICPEHGSVPLTEQEYISQLSQADALWKCPICKHPAQWDDDNYETHYPLQEGN